MRALLSSLLGLALLLTACGDDAPSSVAPASEPSTTVPNPASTESATPWPVPLGAEHQQWTVRILDRVPHDPSAFTQGLELGPTGVLESTGRRGESTVRLTELSTGSISESVGLDPSFFGEGLTISAGEIVVLTWQAGVALRFDATTLEPLGRFDYEGEGWGVCAADDGLWMSDGTAELTRRDAATFAVLETITVRHEGTPVDELNELECIGDHVVANVWKSDEIHVIDPATGIVSATVDATALAAEIDAPDEQAVLNGIADLGDGTLLLGGKLWPTFFVVELVAG